MVLSWDSLVLAFFIGFDWRVLSAGRLSFCEFYWYVRVSSPTFFLYNYKENFFMNLFFGLISDFLVQIQTDRYVLVEFL